MPNIITLSGPYGPILAVLGLVVLFITLRATLALLKPASLDRRRLKERLNSLLFWGGGAAILGFLGQCSGIHQALTQILAATEISPQVVAHGFVISFVPTLFGLGIMAVAVVSWAGLKLMARGTKSGFAGTKSGFAGTKSGSAGPMAALFAFLLFLGGCSGLPGQERPESFTDGVWVLEAGQDQFLWDFSLDGEEVSCLVHDINGSVKLNETPCVTARMEGSRVSVSMDTGVRLEGELQLERGRLVGHLIYPDGSRTETELPWRSKSAFPTLTARGGEVGPYSYRVPKEGDDGWEVASARDAGLDPRVLEEMVAAVERGDLGVIHSLLVARNGRLIMEEYFHGYRATDLHRLASCTKSVSSLLVGLAMQEGAIEGVDTPLLDFFPEARSDHGEGWESLTLENLLTMTMALDWTPTEVQTLHGTGPEFFKRVISRSVSGTPGVDFEYASPNVNLIAGIIRQTTGEQAEDFARRTLFGPMGIQSWDWKGMATEGYNLMDGSLSLLPRDMAKLGQMAMDGGRWQGRQVVDEGYIRAATAWQVGAGQEAEGYGYLWWIMQIPTPRGEPVQAFVANGWGSQFIVVFPSLELVVVTTGGNEYNGKHFSLARALSGILLPSLLAQDS